MLEATNQHWKQCWGRGNDLGYGKSTSGVREDKGQPAAKPFPLRLDLREWVQFRGQMSVGLSDGRKYEFKRRPVNVT